MWIQLLFFRFSFGWIKAVDEDRNSHQIRDQLIGVKVKFGGNLFLRELVKVLDPVFENSLAFIG